MQGLERGNAPNPGPPQGGGSIDQESRSETALRPLNSEKVNRVFLEQSDEGVYIGTSNGENNGGLILSSTNKTFWESISQ